MALDCNATTPAVDAVCNYPDGSTFQISVHATSAASGYAGHQVKVRRTDANLDYFRPPARPLGIMSGGIYGNLRRYQLQADLRPR